MIQINTFKSNAVFKLLRIESDFEESIMNLFKNFVKTEIRVCYALSIEKNLMSHRRYFDSPNCGGCMYKGSSYCWGQCSLNIWKRDRE